MAELVPDTSPPPVVETETHTSRVPLEFSLKYLRAFGELRQRSTGGEIGQLLNGSYSRPVSGLGVAVVDSDTTGGQIILCDVDCYCGCELLEQDIPPVFWFEDACELNPIDGSATLDGNIRFKYRPEYHCWQDEDYPAGDRSVLLFPKRALSWDSLWDSTGSLHYPVTESNGNM